MWDGHYYKCISCGEIFSERISECPSCHSACVRLGANRQLPAFHYSCPRCKLDIVGEWSQIGSMAECPACSRRFQVTAENRRKSSPRRSRSKRKSAAVRDSSASQTLEPDTSAHSSGGGFAHLAFSLLIGFLIGIIAVFWYQKWRTGKPNEKPTIVARQQALVTTRSSAGATGTGKRSQHKVQPVFATCRQCAGRGVICGTCGGAGVYACNCPDCNGTGKKSGSQVLGELVAAPFEFVAAILGNEQAEKELHNLGNGKCRRCNGSGRIDVSCSHRQEDVARCPSCGGAGQIKAN